MDRSKKILSIVGLIVIVAAIAVAAAGSAPKLTAVAPSSPTATPITSIISTDGPAPAASAAATAPATSTYKDGTYQAAAAYMTPGGSETVTLSVTLKAGLVSSSTVSTSGNNPTGKMYQTQFVNGYKPYVTGKPIEDIHLSRVSGSSLTSGGFNDALAQIKTHAL